MPLQKSKISPLSVTAGAFPAIDPSKAKRSVRRFGTSLTVKLIVLVGIFLALPVALYRQFETADWQRRDLMIHGIQHRNALVAQALAIALRDADVLRLDELSTELARFNDDSTTILKLMFRPTGSPENAGFFYVASAPPANIEELQNEMADLTELGILDRLRESCSDGTTLNTNHRRLDGSEEILTSVIPIQTKAGCWVLVSSQPTSEFLNMSIGKPYWQTPEIRIAALFYFAAAVIGILIAASVWRSLDRFGRFAREVRQGRDGGRSFTELNVVPELSTVATDFDSLVGDLRTIAQDIRQTAEDNAHSFKAPLAALQMSLPVIERALPPDNERVQRALTAMQLSVERLNNLVATSPRLDFGKADLIDAPRIRVNFSNLTADILNHYRDLAAEQGIQLMRFLAEDVYVLAADGVLDVAIENVIDNALSFAPPNSKISVTLQKDSRSAQLRIEDEGPGIPPDRIDRIFERYYSARPLALAPGRAVQAESTHSGLGLWIVRQSVQGVGGTVAVTNRATGGLCVVIQLPLADRGA
jgi:two-component system sensor histidine kinase ChvG